MQNWRSCWLSKNIETFTCRDDVLTLLVHLGYLTYEEVPDSYDDDDQVVGFSQNSK